MSNKFADFAFNRRVLALACLYGGVMAVSFYMAYEIRFDFLVDHGAQQERLRLIGLAVGIKLVALILVGQLGSMVTYFSIPDLLRVIGAVTVSSGTLFALRILEVQGFATPRGVILIDYLASIVGLCGVRIGMRVYRERLNPRGRAPAQTQQRIAIIGAGDAGASLAKEFINSPSRGFRPVIFFDDDVSKHGKLVHGVPVVGRPEALAEMKDLDIAKAVIAMPSATAKRVREVILLCTERGLKVETLPSLEELASGRVRASRIRPVEVSDLLGREAINLDSERIRHALEARCVLVTGAGGSIGSELCRQIAALNPKRLLMIDQAEGALFSIEQELNETGLGAIAVPLVGDILDAERMEYIFSRYEPEVVFHAAAHKHVFLMERQPAEAIRNNVLGTRQLATIAAAHGVDAFVLISTDKAINPTSVMGATKRLAEIQLMALASMPPVSGKLMAKATASSSAQKLSGSSTSGGALSAATNNPDAGGGAESGTVSRGHGRMTATGWEPAKTKFMAVRFGNVLGSSGSVIPIFKRQIANGGPVTVTHPDVVRYFMTIPESVGLVLQSFVLGQGGEIFVLDMGQPVKIVDLARQMIELSGFKPGEDIEITFTGLKPGEKLFEELRHKTEEYTATAHPHIMRLKSNAMFSESGVQELEQRLYELDSNELREILRKLVPEYTPHLD
jgi:FlaA1/EpsC-like NDP-sugar epimerase